MLLHKPNENTQKAFEEIDSLIEQAQTDPPKMFPYTTRELANKTGIGNSNVYAYLVSKGLYAKGRRWFYHHNEARHE
jgi:hypothetical protein